MIVFHNYYYSCHHDTDDHCHVELKRFIIIDEHQTKETKIINHHDTLNTLCFKGKKNNQISQITNTHTHTHTRRQKLKHHDKCII